MGDLEKELRSTVAYQQSHLECLSIANSEMCKKATVLDKQGSMKILHTLN